MQADKRHVSKAMELIATALNNNDGTVYPSALGALTAVVETDKEQIGPAMQLIEGALKKDENVLDAALTPLKTIVEADKKQVPRVRKFIPEAIRLVFRKRFPTTGVQFVEAVLKADPTQAAAVFNELLNVLKEHESGKIRSNCLRILEMISEQHSKQLSSKKAMASIQNALEKGDAALRRASLDALPVVLQADKSHASKAMELIEQAFKSDNAAVVHRVGLDALLEVVRVDKHYASRAMALIEEAFKEDVSNLYTALVNLLGSNVIPEPDASQLVQKVLQGQGHSLRLNYEYTGVLSEISTSQLIKGYCKVAASTRTFWRPYLLNRLYIQPLVIKGTQLTLYENVGDATVWKMPASQVEALKKALRDAPSTCKTCNVCVVQ